MDLSNLTIKKASELLNNKQVSSVELTSFYLDRIKKFDPEIGAYLATNEEVSFRQSKESDKRRKNQNSKSQFDGVPIALKDVLVTKDFPTTAASKMLEGFMSPYDATVVRKLREAGFVFLGKTNMDEFAMGSSTENSAYKVTKNPWDYSRAPGGSSGGSAASVAADLATASLGSDTGGSIRQPAGLCGIVGLKPTYGRVSRYGLIAMASSLDQIGPMTKTVEDSQLLFECIAGHDSNDATSVDKNAAILRQNSHKNITNGNLSGLKIGVPKEYFVAGMSKNVKQIAHNTLKKLDKEGARIIDISLPNVKYAVSAYYILVFVEVASNLARYDGIRFGLKSKTLQNIKTEELKNYIDDVKNVRAHGFGAEVKRRIVLGTFASSAGYAEKYYFQAQKARALIKKDFEDAFKQVDIILSPVWPTVGLKIGEKVDDPLAMYLSDIFTIPVNLAGLPAISIPAGFVEEDGKKLPVGLQLIGPQFSEQLLFDIANAYHQAIGYEFVSPLK